MKKADYLIKINEEQIDALIRACDVYTRISAHQLSFVLDTIVDIPTDKIQEMQKLCNELKSLCVENNKRNRTTKILYDIYQQLRRTMAWDRNPNGGVTVDFSPLLRTSDSPVLEITRLDSFEDGRLTSIPEKDGIYFVWRKYESERTANTIEIKTIDGERWGFNQDYDLKAKLSEMQDEYLWKKIK